MHPRILVAVLLMFALCGVSLVGAAQTTTVAAGNQTIVQTVQANPNLSTLMTALQAAGLVETLSGSGPFTVFAPTNDAFKALPPGTLDALLGNRTGLSNVLAYHVVEGSLLATQVASRPSLPTVQGQPLAVTVLSGGVVRVDGANIVQTDIRASNGVIHVIDAVMIPPAGTPAPTLSLTPAITATATPTPTPTAAGFDAVLVSACALAGIALLVGVRRRL
ncbi:MAG: fasciclin domain-containing protein [Methanospirillum sp.]